MFLNVKIKLTAYDFQNNFTSKNHAAYSSCRELRLKQTADFTKMITEVYKQEEKGSAASEDCMHSHWNFCFGAFPCFFLLIMQP